MKLGDMQVLGQPPAQFLKALAVIADALHASFDAQPWLSSLGKTKGSCVLSSLAVRDFLFAIGFKDVEVRPVFVTMRALKGEEVVHSLGIGEPKRGDAKALPGRWVGHMVVVVPSVGYLVDTTLYPAQRPQWPGLPGMMAAPLFRFDEGEELFGMKLIAGVRTETPDGAFDALWLDQPWNKAWKKGPDASRWRREAVVAALKEKFGSFAEA